MTAPATTRRAGPFNGNGVTTSFPFTFKVFATSDIAVTRTSAGIETVLALGVDYSVSLNGDQDTSPGGTITYPISGAPLAVGQVLVAVGSLPYDQTADLPSGGNYRAIVIENALDRTVMQVQQLAEEIGRSLTLPPSAASADTELPTPEANKVIGWNETGTALVNLDSADLASVVVAGTSYTNVFSGTGSQTAFSLSANPGSVNALDVAIGGVSQVNGVDFTVSGTTLTFTSAPPSGTGNVAVRYSAALPQGTVSATGVTYTAAGTGASATAAQTVLDRRYVTPLEFGAVGNGTADDTSAVNAAVATGRDVNIPRGYTFAVTGNVTGFANGQRIFGGGVIKKLGSSVLPVCLLPDESDGVWFDGVEFDGTSSLFSAGNAVPAILGYITKSLKVTGCYFHDVVDCGIKLRDGANLYAAGNRFWNVGENGIELRNYTTDVRTGGAYTGTRPVLEGNHTIIGNTFEKITRYENPAGPLVDACGVNFTGATGYPQRNVRIQGNNFVDCLRGVWTENNDTGSRGEGIAIVGNTFELGINGGTAENIYGKAGVGLIGAAHTVVTGNTFRNVANTNPVGTETACVIVSGSAGVLEGEDIEIANNVFIDDTGDTDRTEWGVYCLVGSNIRIHHNHFSGFATGNVYLDPTYVTDAASYANTGATTHQTWAQPVPVVFIRVDIPAGSDQSTYPWGMTTDTEAVLPSPGRVVGISVKLSTAITAGNLTVKVLANGTEDTDLRLTNADFTATVATKAIDAFSAAQTAAAQRYKVVLTTDGSFAPTTMDAVITLFVDLAWKA